MMDQLFTIIEKHLLKSVTQHLRFSRILGYNLPEANNREADVEKKLYKQKLNIPYKSSRQVIQMITRKLSTENVTENATSENSAQENSTHCIHQNSQ